MATGKIIQADKVEGLADVPNFVPNPSGLLNTVGWTEGEYTAAARPSGTFTANSGAGKFSISRTTTNTLGMTGTSLVFTKASGNQQGRAIETAFPLPLDYRAKVLQLNNSYINTSTNASDFAAGSKTTDSDMIFYCAFSTDGGTTYTVAEPSSFKLLSNSKDNSDPFNGSIQSPYNATHMKLIAYVATTSTTAWSIKTVLAVKPSQYVYGTPITDWVSYTPTVTHNSGTATNYGTNGRWRRVGDQLEVTAAMFFNNSSVGTWTGLYFGLPSGLTIDTSKISAEGSSISVGNASILDTGTTVFSGTVFYYNSITDKVGVAPLATNLNFGDYPLATNNVPMPATTGDTYLANFSVPILGWSSSTQVSDGYDGRDVAAKVTMSADQTGVSGAAALPFNTISLDTTGSFNTSTYKFKAPSSGNYRVSAHVRFSSLSANAEAGIPLFVDGSVIDYIGTQQLSSGSFAVISGSTILKLNAGQEVQIGRYTSNGTYTVTSAYTSFSIEKLSGHPTISAQETVCMRVSGSLTGQSFPFATITTPIQMPTIETDTHGMWTAGSTHAAKIPVSGLYMVNVKLNFTNPTATTTSIPFYFSLRKNGVNVQSWAENDSLYTAKPFSGPAESREGFRTVTLRFKAGDLITVAATVIASSSAGNISVVTSGNGHSLEIIKVGN